MTATALLIFLARALNCVKCSSNIKVSHVYWLRYKNSAIWLRLMQRLRNLTIFPVRGRVSTQKHHKHPQQMQVEQRQHRPQFAALHSSGPRTGIKTRPVHMKSLALIVLLARSDATKCKLALLSAPPRRSDPLQSARGGKHETSGYRQGVTSLLSHSESPSGPLFHHLQ